ncbi:hypothetical protein GCM10009837_64040 [Streptomyces durmitorensis]
MTDARPGGATGAGELIGAHPGDGVNGRIVHIGEASPLAVRCRKRGPDPAFVKSFGPGPSTPLGGPSNIRVT